MMGSLILKLIIMPDLFSSCPALTGHHSFLSASAGSALALFQYWKPATPIVSIIITTNVNMKVHADRPVCSTKFSSHLLTA